MIKRLLWLMAMVGVGVVKGWALPQDSIRTTEKTWLFGVGRTHVLDTYLSPQNYLGGAVALQHRTARMAHFGAQRWQVVAHYGLELGRAQAKSNDNNAWEAHLTAAVGVLREWRWGNRWRLAGGPMMEGGTGGTYLPHNGNNPAQAKGFVRCGVEGKADYRWSWGRKQLLWRTELSVPMVGMAFAPEYGASYYEMFKVDAPKHSFALTHMGNAPCVRLSSTLTLPLRRARLTVGYSAVVEQQDIHYIKQHSWQHCVMVGYTRLIRLVR